MARGQRSSIAKLPKELVELANQLINNGHTIAEITEKLQELGAEVSHSAVGRYTKNVREQMKQLQEAREAAKMWGDKFLEDPSGDVGRLVSDMLHMVAYNTVSEMSNAEKVKAGEIMNLAIAMEKLSKSRAIDLKVYVERKQIREQAAKTASDVTKAVKKAGLSDATVQAIRSSILGIGE